MPLADPLADIAYLPEQPAHDPEIELINAEAFGPGRFVRAAYRIREGGPHDRTCSFVAMDGAAVIASVRMTPIAAGNGRALLLGPLAVRPPYKNLGIGRRLVRMALDGAREADCGLVILIGDAPYYGPLGFQPVPPGRMNFPRPLDPRRLLAVEIMPGALEAMRGDVVHAGAAGGERGMVGCDLQAADSSVQPPQAISAAPAK